MIGGTVDRHSITRTRPQFVDDGHGNTETVWPDPADAVSITGWSVDAGSTQADEQNRDGDRIDYTLRGPIDADVDRRDKITLFGDDFHIDGAVMRQPGPTAITSHCIIRLTRWEG